MFEILRKSLATGVVTTSYPETPAAIASNARGRPEIDFAQWKDARPAATICPTGAISCADGDGTRTATLDLGACIFCGLCAEVDPAIRMTNRCELAARQRGDLRTIAKYRLRPDGTHEAFLTKSAEQDEQGPSPSPPLEERDGERRPFPMYPAAGSWRGGPLNPRLRQEGNPSRPLAASCKCGSIKSWAVRCTSAK